MIYSTQLLLISRFGSKNKQYGQILDTQVRLDASEGTLLRLLAEAAIEATTILTSSLPTNQVFRMLYVLNTDGEASDGAAATEYFVKEYNALKAKFPNMIEARTFVLGIGANHDQKVFSLIILFSHTLYLNLNK